MRTGRKQGRTKRLVPPLQPRYSSNLPHARMSTSFNQGQHDDSARPRARKIASKASQERKSNDDELMGGEGKAQSGGWICRANAWQARRSRRARLITLSSSLVLSYLVLFSTIANGNPRYCWFLSTILTCAVQTIEPPISRICLQHKAY